MVAEQRKNTAAGEHPPTLLGGTAIRPVERSGLEAIRYFFHNPETGAIFTRTPKSWALIFLFYCVYYSCLAAFWYGMLQLFFTMLPYEKPMWTLDDGIIGSNPGLGLRPKQADATLDSSMLRLKWDDANNVTSEDYEKNRNADWAERYRQFLEKGYQPDPEGFLVNCPNGPTDDVKKGRAACKFDVERSLGKCAQYPYGYMTWDGQSVGQEQVEPCVLVKINKIYGWKPQTCTDKELDLYINDYEPKDEMTEAIKQRLKASPEVFVECTGENPADKDVLVAPGAVSYFPDKGVIDADSYLPYQTPHKPYQSPLVAVKFGASIPRGQLVHVQCKLWFCGAKHSKKDRMGLVRFELLLDDAPEED